MKLFNFFLKKLALCALTAATAAGAAYADDILAFPGAEGFGRYAKGARAVANPEVYHVTNLNDSGEGSFRDAVSSEGRIIVIDVAGTIKITSPLVVKGNNTILGQTAPGEGIQIYGDRVSFSGASNIICRYIRFRMGKSGTSGADACGIANGTDMIFDHITALWGRDENFSVNWDNKGTQPGNITIQNSIIGQGLQSHSCGGLIQTDGGVTIYRNLYIENKTRNVKAKGLNQYVNNVIYNWGNGGAYIMGDTEGASWAHIENNYFIKGPWNSATEPFTRGTSAFHYYGPGNYYDSNKNGTLDGTLLDDEGTSGIQNDGSKSTSVDSFDALNSLTIREIIHDSDGNVTSEKDRTIPKEFPVISEIMTAEEAVAWIIDNVGPVLPVRDEVDQYLIDELISYGTSGTKNGISDETTLSHGGTGTISGGTKPTDSDGDGIPDEWETANGLNPNDASDAVKLNSEGYTYLEAYSFSITEAFPYIKKPTNLTVTDQQKNTISLSWDLNNNTEHGFEIETSTDGTTYTVAAQAEAGITTYTVTGLTEKTKYYVRLRSVGDDGLASEYTDVVTAETIGDPSAPAQSTDPFPAVGAKEGIANGITFTWVDDIKAYGGDVTYALYLGTSAESLELKAEGLTKTEWECGENELEAGMTYYWRIDATNSIGTTTGTVWSFTTTAGGVLFYADFNTLPEEYGAAYASTVGSGSNKDIFAKGSTNKSLTFNDMIIGVGATSSRIVAMAGCCSDDTEKDYGPATEDDKGASSCAIQFTQGSGYVTTPTVQGPCVITYYLGNTGSSQQTVKLYTIAGGEKEEESLVLGAKKRIFKFSKTYTNAGEVQFRLESNGKKINVNDILIERYIAPDGNEPLEMTAGDLVNNVEYTDGSISLGFNQEVKYAGTATVSGEHQYEDITVGVSGTKLNIAYDALDANSTYTVKFVNGDLTNVAGDQSFIGEVQIITGDFPRAKEEGETHWGKAIKTLPVNFAPFDAVAPYETVGSLIQEKQNDYPHWCQVGGGDNAGEITSEYVAFRSSTSSDKVMAYFNDAAKKIYLNIDAEDGTSVRLKIQETRNADIAPTWRTIRVLTEEDLPFEDEIELNSEARFVKILPSSISGTVRINGFRISDADGNFGSDYDFEKSGIDDIIVNEPDEEDGPIYNILGIQVDETYKGIVIKKGKKYIQR